MEHPIKTKIITPVTLCSITPTNLKKSKFKISDLISLTNKFFVT